MLKKFSLKNFKNFKDELVLDLSKVNNYGFSTMAIRNKIVKVALIYGENASGKSNLGYGLFDIILHLTDKQKNLYFYRLYGNLDQNQNQDTEFSYEFEFDEGTLLYRYRKNLHKSCWKRIYGLTVICFCSMITHNIKGKFCWKALNR